MADLTDTQLGFLIDNITSVEFMSTAIRGDMLEAFFELKRHRAAMKRLEEYAVRLETNSTPGKFVAEGIRGCIKGD